MWGMTNSIRPFLRHSPSRLETSCHSVQEPDADTPCRKPLRLHPATPTPSASPVSGVLVGHGLRTLACARVACGPPASAHVDSQHASGVTRATGQAWPRLPWRALQMRSPSLPLSALHPAGTIFALRRGRRPATPAVGPRAQCPVSCGASRAQPLPRLLRASHPERDGHRVPLKKRGLYHNESHQHSCLSWQQGET